ncbi:MAG: sulfite exporter TauE/SafE family protein [Dehalococcoidia bacterium]|nr:sulfite exporter TauE/SafE family protein [Dehalococcoidia bacterium]
MLDALVYLGLSLAATVAGAINAVAGGGSLISFPALIWAGYSAKTANVTNTVAIWPGTVGGSFGYREELWRQRRRVIALLPPAAAGGLLGSAVLLATPTSAFDAIVPFLILFACGLLALQTPLSRFAQTHRLVSGSSGDVPLVLRAVVFVLAIYGGYFGAGLGIMMLAVLSVLLPDEIQHSNALKGLVALIVNAVAVIYFIAASFIGTGYIRWGAAGVMALGAITGGYLGVGVARRLGGTWLKVTVIAYGLVVVGVLLAS